MAERRNLNIRIQIIVSDSISYKDLSRADSSCTGSFKKEEISRSLETLIDSAVGKILDDIQTVFQPKPKMVEIIDNPVEATETND